LSFDKISNIRKFGILQTTKQLYKKEGINGFFRGVTVACIMGAPASCLFFGSYEYFKKKFKHNKYTENSMVINFAAAVGAEFISSILWVPIDVVKERLQV